MSVPNIVFYKDSLTFADKSLLFSEDVVGRKAESLFEIIKLGLPTPPFFTVTTQVFNSFIKQLTAKVQPTSIEELQQAIINTPLPPVIMNDLKRFYSKLSFLGKSWVAVRSSISAPNYKHLTFSGILDTFLNIRGVDELETAIKQVYASLLSERSIAYIKHNNLSLSKINVAIIVQKMVTSEISGVAYTYNPITEANDLVTIEAVFGLGDVIPTGELNPDVYIIDKVTKSLIEKKIMPQQWMKTRAINDEDGDNFHTKKITLSPIWQYAQKLTEEQIKELLAVILTVEKHFKRHYILEWTISANKLYILQLKQARVNIKTYYSTTQQKVKQEKTRSKNKKHTQKAKPEKANILDNAKLLLTGLPISKGTAKGNVLLVTEPMLNNPEMLEDIKNTVDNNYILVTDFFDSRLEHLALQAAGLISDTGGANADLALVLRESGIPAIGNTRIATRILENKQHIYIHADSGAIYLLKEDKKTTPKTKSKNNKKKNQINELFDQENSSEKPVVSKDIKVIMPPESAISLYLPDPKWAFYYNSNLKELDKESILNLKQNQAIFTTISKDDLNQKLVKNITALRKDAQLPVTIGIYGNTYDEFIEIKRFLSAKKIIRSSKLKIIPVINTVAELWNTTKYLKPFVDGIAIDFIGLYEAYANKEFSPTDKNFVDFLAPHTEKVRKHKYDILMAIMNKPSLHIKNFIKLGFSSIAFTEKPKTYKEVIQIINALSGIALT